VPGKAAGGLDSDAIGAEENAARWDAGV
jgi:hypothetical protein